MIKTNIHSYVDLITNSSTTIYTYQNSVGQAKELVQEMLNLQGITDKTPDDIFYYGVFCEDYVYLERVDKDEEDVPKITAEYNTPEYNKQQKIQEEWFENLKLSIMKGEIERPKWMNEIEEDNDYYDPSTDLYLIPKDDKYKAFGEKMKNLLDSVGADGGYDG